MYAYGLYVEKKYVYYTHIREFPRIMVFTLLTATLSFVLVLMSVSTVSEMPSLHFFTQSSILTFFFLFLFLFFLVFFSFFFCLDCRHRSFSVCVYIFIHLCNILYCICLLLCNIIIYIDIVYHSKR